MNKRLLLNVGAALSACVMAVSAYAQPVAQPPASPTTPPPAAAQPRAGSSAAAQDRRLADYIVAIVQREPITHAQVLTSVLSIKHRNIGQELPADDVLYNLALDQLISQSALAQRANELGMRIEPKMLDQAMETVASNSGTTVAKMRQTMEDAGIPFSTFRRDVEQQLLMMQLREKTLDPTITVSNAELEAYLAQTSGEPGSGQAQINLAQILIAVPENATSAQEKALEAKAQEVYKQAQASRADFFALVDKYSDDENAAVSRGVMGARPTSRYPEIFMTAVGSLRAGDVAPPVRSGAGFHIIKVLEREQAAVSAVVQTHARHILLNTTDKASEQEAIAKLQSAKASIEAGLVPFETLAKEISQDVSAQSGGELGWTAAGMFVPEFERVMEKLQPGQMSEPVVTRFGVHLIQVLERREAQLTPSQLREVARETLHQNKVEQAMDEWAREIRSRAYIEMREPVR